jgi:hypothetical protein
MIKDDITIEKKEKLEFKPLPENIYQVELLDLSSETRPTYDTKNKSDAEKIMETVLSFQFTLLAGKDTDGTPLRGRNVWQNFVPTYLYEGNKGKNKLYQIVEALLGRQLTPKDEATMDKDFLNGLIGSQCRVGIKNKNSAKGQVFSNIETLYPVEMEMPSLTAEEKEKATVKEKKDDEADKEYDDYDANKPGETMAEDIVNPDDIPF